MATKTLKLQYLTLALIFSFVTQIAPARFAYGISPSAASGQPAISCVSAFSTGASQTIRISGSGLGSLDAYSGNSSDIEISDLTGGWSAGYGNDWVTLQIVSWADDQIEIGGFGGGYGSSGFALGTGDQIQISIWNAQTGAGPAIYNTTVGSQAGAGGALDRSFGNDGLVRLPNYGGANAIAIQANGSIVAAGGTEFATIARFTPAGTLDSSFGNGGVFQITLANCANCSVANTIALQSDGKILVVGTNSPIQQYQTSYFLARLTSVGKLDEAFGNGGIANVPASSFGGSCGFTSANSVNVSPIDGDVIVTGTGDPGCVIGSYDTVVAAFRSDGTLDATFGSGGYTAVAIGSTITSGSATIQPDDGEILVSGTRTDSNQNTDFSLLRFTSSGELDKTFSNGTGGVLTGIGSGKAPLISTGTLISDCLTRADDSSSVTILFWAITCGIDIGEAAFPANTTSDGASALTLQPDGKPLEAGMALLGTQTDLAVTRYLSNGTLDVSFGAYAGWFPLPILGCTSASADAIALQTDGDIVVAGTGCGNVALARFLPSGLPDPAFGAGGVVQSVIPLPSGKVGFESGQATGVALQSDGKIVVAATGTPPFPPSEFVLFRYSGIGSSGCSAEDIPSPPTGLKVVVR